MFGTISFNNEMLKARIIELYGSQRQFAGFIRTSISTVNAKLNGRSDLSLDEIEKWSDALFIPVYDIPKYFFSRII